MGIHQRRTHPEYVASCWACRLATVAVASAEQRASQAREKSLSADLSAYKRMRMQGWQPQGTRGAAYVESTARSRTEVEHPALMSLPDASREFLHEATQASLGVPDMLSAHKTGDTQ